MLWCDSIGLHPLPAAPGTVAELADPSDRGPAGITDYDETAKPFKWTYAADPLVA